MPNEDAVPPPNLLGLTTEIIVKHVQGNKIAPDQLPALITAVHRTLTGLGRPEAQPELARPEPAVSIRHSVTSDPIVCLECGMNAKMLKLHLRTAHDLSPDVYRERWGLPRDYPMTAPSYSRQRSGLAKQIGLGRKSGTAQGRGRPPKGANPE